VGRLKRLAYKDDIIIANKCREFKNMLGASCNKEITREKSIRKKARCEQTQGLKIGRRKVKANPTWLRLRLRRA